MQQSPARLSWRRRRAVLLLLCGACVSLEFSIASRAAADTIVAAERIPTTWPDRMAAALRAVRSEIDAGV